MTKRKKNREVRKKGRVEGKNDRMKEIRDGR